MKKHSAILKKIARFSFAAASCASLMLAPVNGITTSLQNNCITASASSSNFNQDTLVLSSGKSVYVSNGNEKIWYSKNKKYQLKLTKSGELIISESNSTQALSSNKQALWSSNSSIGKNSASASLRFVLQGDGNLVLYKIGSNNTSTAIWNSQTVTKVGCNSISLRFSDEGELYLYSSFLSQSIWSSRSQIECTAKSNTVLKGTQCISSKNRNYRAIMQNDGNFVVYQKIGNTEKVRWHTHTSGNNGAFLALQQDGNLVVYSRNHQPLFNPGTSSSSFANYKLSLGDDGVLRLVRKSDNRQIWTSQ